MLVLFEIREKLRTIYQKFSTYINIVARMIFCVVVFLTIGSAIGFDPRVSSTTIALGLGVVGGFLPASIVALLCSVLVLVEVYSVSAVLALFVALVFLVLYFLLIRYTPKGGYILLAMPVLLHWGMPFVMPILLGLVASPVTIVPVVCGTVVFYVLKAINDVSKNSDATNPDEALAVFRTVVDKFIKNKEMIIVIVALSVILAVVYVIRKRKINNCSEIAAISGTIMSIVVFLLACLIMDLDMSIVKVILFSLLGGAIAYIVKFMKIALDYSAVENVTFEDDDYFYYVKAVPKIKLSEKESTVKRISNKNKKKSIFAVVDDETDEIEEDDSELDTQMQIEERMTAQLDKTVEEINRMFRE